MMNKIAYTFSDVEIPPQYSEVLHRDDVDLTTNFGSFQLKVPIFTSPMKTITGPKMAQTISDLGGIGVLHRFGTVDELLSDYYATNIPCFVSVGVQESDKDLFNKFYKEGARLFCIDVAHGHHISMKKMLKWIRVNYSAPFERPCIMAGNIATKEGAEDLVDWGADLLRVGIGPGAACLTRRNTGVGVPQLYALEQVWNVVQERHYEAKIIADGGLTVAGDVAKALVYSHGVMLGSMFSGTAETPGKVFKDVNGQYYKVYMGSASGENKASCGKSTDFVEGCAKQIPFKGKVKYVVREIVQGVKSTCSYVGAFNLNEFRENIQQNDGFLHISGGAKVESKY